MTDRARLLWVFGAAVIVQIAGRVRDLAWHASHGEFEAMRQQFEAHWLLWLGVAATLAVSAFALRRLAADDPTRPGFVVTLWTGVAYVPVSVWHFVEHANHSDPQVAHVLLALGQIGMLVGVVMVFVSARRAGAPALSEP